MKIIREPLRLSYEEELERDLAVESSHAPSLLARMPLPLCLLDVIAALKH